MLKYNNKMLMKNVRVARESWERMKGLMFEDKKNFNYALAMEMQGEGTITSSIHMVFVFFPIDVLFLNKEKKVVDKVTLEPFVPNYTPKKPAKYVVELPKGKAKKVKIGNTISW